MFDITVMLRLAGLEINGAKTSVTCSGVGRQQWKLSGTCCNEKGLKVLGRLTSMSQPTDTDLEARIKHGYWKFAVMRSVLWQGTPLKHRVDILCSTVLQAILWGAETWTPTKARLSCLRATHLQMLHSLSSFRRSTTLKGPHISAFSMTGSAFSSRRRLRGCFWMRSFCECMLDGMGMLLEWEMTNMPRCCCVGEITAGGEKNKTNVKVIGMLRVVEIGANGKRHLFGMWVKNWQKEAQNRDRWKKYEDDTVVAFKEVHPRKIAKTQEVPRNRSTQTDPSSIPACAKRMMRCPERGATMDNNCEVPRKRCTDSDLDGAAKAKHCWS